MVDPAQHRVRVEMRDMARRQPQILQPGDEQLQGDSHLQPGQRRADAKMRAEAEGEMRPGALAVRIELIRTLRVFRRVAIGGAPVEINRKRCVAL